MREIGSTVAPVIPGFESIEDMANSGKHEVRFGKGGVVGGLAAIATGGMLYLRNSKNKEFRDEFCVPLMLTGSLAVVAGVSAMKEGAAHQEIATLLAEAAERGVSVITNR
jgi:hypothetical protein